jgi:hypothetical protein
LKSFSCNAPTSDRTLTLEDDLNLFPRSDINFRPRDAFDPTERDSSLSLDLDVKVFGTSRLPESDLERGFSSVRGLLCLDQGRHEGDNPLEDVGVSVGIRMSDIDGRESL